MASVEVRCGGGDMSTWTGMVRNSISSFSLWKLNVFMTCVCKF